MRQPPPRVTHKTQIRILRDLGDHCGLIIWRYLRCCGPTDDAQGSHELAEDELMARKWVRGSGGQEQARNNESTK